MGVQDLMLLLKTKCPSVLKKERRRINNAWVDAPLLVMATYKKAQADNRDPFDALRLSFRKIISEIKAICDGDIHMVFDGCTRSEKFSTVRKRKTANEKFSNSRRITFAQLLEQDLLISQEVCQSAQSLQSLQGAQSLQSTQPKDHDTLILGEKCEVFVEAFPAYALVLSAAKAIAAQCIVEHGIHDAEEYIAEKMKKGDAAITTDSDCLVFGCSTMIKSFGNEDETWIDLDDVLQSLSLTMDQFHSLAIILGNDFNARIPKCGLETCFKEIKKENFSMETFAQKHAEDKRQQWLEDCAKTRKIFQRSVY